MRRALGGVGDEETAKYDKACWEERKAYFSPQEIVELTMVICHFNLLKIINDTLAPRPGSAARNNEDAQGADRQVRGLR